MSEPNAAEQIRLDAAEALAIGRDALRSLGFSADDAAMIAGHLVTNASSGYPFASLPRILAMRDAPQLKQPTQPLRIVKETPVSLQIDGGNQVAYVAITRAAELALAKVQQSGVCIMGVGNSWYSGRLANYLEPIARAGYVGIHVSSSIGQVAPHGAAKAMFGTNPICVGLPNAPDPVIIDLGTSQTMWGHVLLQAFLGIPLPAGQGIDAAGLPTTDAAAVASGGAVLPIAGHRGNALSFAVQALGLLGAAVTPWEQYQGRGYLFVLFDPALLTPRERFQHDLQALIARIKALPRQPGVDEILIPSERSYRARIESARDGMLFDRKVVDELRRMGGRNEP